MGRGACERRQGAGGKVRVSRAANGGRWIVKTTRHTHERNCYSEFASEKLLQRNCSSEIATAKLLQRNCSSKIATPKLLQRNCFGDIASAKNFSSEISPAKLLRRHCLSEISATKLLERNWFGDIASANFPQRNCFLLQVHKRCCKALPGLKIPPAVHRSTAALGCPEPSRNRA